MTNSADPDHLAFSECTLSEKTGHIRVQEDQGLTPLVNAGLMRFYTLCQKVLSLKGTKSFNSRVLSL